jgi:membrane protease YdiL (CAAX protease family)
MDSVDVQSKNKKAHQAITVWLLFFASALIINLLIPLAFGLNLHDWTFSGSKGLLLFPVVYAGFFIVVPLVLTKGWATVKKPSFFVPMAAAMVSVVFWIQVPYLAAIAIVVFVYLHWRFNLSDLGFKSKGWKGDVLAILLVGVLGLLQAFSSSSTVSIAFVPAVSATLFRMFANPASTVENLFYFGFLTERLGARWSRHLVPFLVGAMYTAHEMTNPEYWYQGTSFVFIFIGVILFAAVYLWRRNIAVTWLSDGFRWFLSNLF